MFFFLFFFFSFLVRVDELWKTWPVIRKRVQVGLTLQYSKHTWKMQSKVAARQENASPWFALVAMQTVSVP